MRTRTFAALILAATLLPLSAHAHHVASCEAAISTGEGAVGRLEAQLRGAIRASANAGCDPFGGLMGRPGCSERIDGIRALAHQIEFAELNGGTVSSHPCAGAVALTGNDAVQVGLATVRPTDHDDARHEPSALGDAIRSAATARPISRERQSVRSVGPVFLPEDDGRFEEIAKGGADLPHSAANALVSWIGIGAAPRGKNDRLVPDAALATASVE